MRNTFSLEEILAYIECSRRSGNLDIPAFLDMLEPELLDSVMALVAENEEENCLSSIDELASSGEPVYLVDERVSLNRHVAQSMKELLGDTGVRILIEGEDSLGSLKVHMAKSLGDLQPIIPWKPRLSIAGLGDVGGTLLTGLRLLGGDDIGAIRIFDPDANKVRRYELEVNEISDGGLMPEVIGSAYQELLDCDILIFTVSLGVPPLGTDLKDVRMVQFEKNSQVLLQYAKDAEERGFRGMYFIVSDPVDQLCMSLMVNGGIAPERIRGFGLGVMEGRARYIAKEMGVSKDDLRVYGPHGKGIIAVNSLSEYDEEISDELAERTEHENFRIRETGFKPYIAPALSSGAIQILRLIRGEYHASAWFDGKVFFGARSMLSEGFTQPEKIQLKGILPKLESCENFLASFFR